MSIPTPASLRKVNRRLDRQRREAELALAAMKDRGVTLQHFGRNDWRLSNGRHVSPTVANILTFDRHVAAVGDSLFGAECPELSQTWRWIDE
jgi:hypothetical protein